MFHVRTEVFVNSQHNPLFPMASFKFTHPPDIMLKREGPGACGQIYCRPNDCFIDYQLEGFHEDPYWHERVKFRKGTADEMGRYKCQAKVDQTDPESALIWIPNNCPQGHSASSFTEPIVSLFSAAAHLRNDGGGSAGIVRFDMQQPVGEYNVVLVAEINLPNGIKLAQVLDSKVRVADMSFNDQPVSYMPDLKLEGDTCVLREEADESVDIFADSCRSPESELTGGEPSLPIKQTAIEVQCGRPEFYLNSQGSQNRDGPNLGTSIEFAFYDPDFVRPGASTCQQYVGQTIDFIDSANMLPKGLVVSETMHNPDNGVSKVQIEWRPVCEDRSQVGLFQLCFYAKDKVLQNAALFTPSYSVPSPAPAAWVVKEPEERAYHPTCIYLRSMGPSANPAPVLNSRNKNNRGVPKTCCGTEEGQNSAQFLKCAGSGVESDNGIKVGNEYVLGCSSGAGATCENYELIVSAESENDFFTTHIRFFYPDASNILPFEVSASKRGCDLSENWLDDFQDCTSNENVKDKVAAKLTVNAAELRQNVNRICYQAFQTSPDDVDEDTWRAFYKTSPTSKSCVTCFILNVINAPVWPPEFLVPNNQRISVAVGSTGRVKLTTRNLGSGTTSIFILGDPGAPDGSHLTDMVDQGDGQTFERVFEYTPTVEQVGLQSTVCFASSTVQDSNTESGPPPFSEVLCYEFYVYVEWLTWVSDPCPFPEDNGACRAQGVATATVGCTVESLITAKDNGYYDIKLQLQKYPQCSNCYYRTDLNKNMGVFKCGAGVTDGCCGDGKCNGAETGTGLSSLPLRIRSNY